MYQTLKKTFLKFSEIQESMAKIIKLYVGDFSKYSYSELTSLTESLKDRDTRLQVYLKQKSKLHARKEKLWVTGNIASWKIEGEINNSKLLGDKDLAFSKMLPTETKEMVQKQNEFGFINYQVVSEIGKFFTGAQFRDNTHFISMSQSFIDWHEQAKSVWEQLIEDLSGIKRELLNYNHQQV